ncbi:MAG: hypothetical protein GY710_14415 [Desulfobacteraceae bacterium]|nr:hypothetical protein [Desulfobacteraceae bacterium]
MKKTIYTLIIVLIFIGSELGYCAQVKSSIIESNLMVSAENATQGGSFLNVDTEAAKAVHRAVATQSENLNTHSQLILAHEGQPLDTSSGGLLDQLLNGLNSDNPDFTMISLIRILYFTNAYDSIILPELQNFLYWPEQGKSVDYCYWSENHMIMWLSTGYLLQQREGWAMDSLMEDRLRHWLDLKLTYGFYEWHAPIYWAFTLSALLNLADFADDGDIKADAEAVAKRLLKEMLRLTNDKGVYFPVASRGKYNKYNTPYNYYFSPVIHMLTQLNDPPTGASLPSSFVATSSVNFDDVSDSWSLVENTFFNFGHHINDNVHSGFPRQDRTLFQWSAGGYYHPDVADDTAYTVNYYDFDGIPGIPIFLANWTSSLGATFSRSSVISQATFHIYKNQGVALSSVYAYNPGYFGYQQFPWMATVDDLAVWTQSGKVYSDWGDRSNDNVNTHLPRVMQDENIALIMYWPNTSIVATQTTDVTLHWKDSDFDQIASYDRWIIGKRNDSYIAVYRHRTGTNNGWYYSQTNNGRQYWAVVVGNLSTHGSFSDFVNMVEQASTRESYTWSFSSGFKYYARVTIDGKTISHTWD